MATKKAKLDNIKDQKTRSVESYQNQKTVYYLIVPQSKESSNEWALVPYEYKAGSNPRHIYNVIDKHSKKLGWPTNKVIAQWAGDIDDSISKAEKSKEMYEPRKDEFPIQYHDAIKTIKRLEKAKQLMNSGKEAKIETNESLSDFADAADRDHEVQMARSDLYKLAEYSIKLYDMLKNISEEEGLQGWQQAKITKASDYISSVYHSLDYEKNIEDKKQMDAMVLAQSAKESTDPYKKKLHQRLSEKSVSKSQQQAAGIALAAKRKGEKPKGKGASAQMAKMSTKDLEDFAGTKHKGLPKKVKENDDDETKIPTVRGRGAVTPYQAKLWKDDAEEKSERALERYPDFFNDDHMRRLQEIHDLINDTLNPERIYINHRVGTKNTGPFSVVKAVYPTWPANLRKSSSVRQREFHNPIKQLGGIVKNLESSPGIMVHVFNNKR